MEDSDVAEAIRLMRVATQNAATDPRTGTIDMDMIATGQGASDRCGFGCTIYRYLTTMLTMSRGTLLYFVLRRFGATVFGEKSHSLLAPTVGLRL